MRAEAVWLGSSKAYLDLKAFWWRGDSSSEDGGQLVDDSSYNDEGKASGRETVAVETRIVAVVGEGCFN